MTENNLRLDEIAAFAEKHLHASYRKRTRAERINLERYLSGPAYRWQHTLRVAQFGKVIAENETVNVENVVAACLLHDLAWFDTRAENSREHGRLGARLARPILQQTGFASVEVETICYAIAAHVDVDRPASLEARIVSDADNVDRFGPYRILQWCFPDIDDYTRLVAKLVERIQRLEQYRIETPLFTQTGQQLFREQLDLQIKFFSQFVGEKELSVMPRL